MQAGKHAVISAMAYTWGKGLEKIDIWKHIIINLTTLTNNIHSKTHQIILLIDANEEFISRDKSIVRLLNETNIIDPITNKHGIVD